MNKLLFFLSENISNPYALTAILSALPISECKGAIMTAVGIGVSPLYAFLFSILGSTLIIPFIVLLFKPLLALLMKIPFLKNLGEKIQNHNIEKAKELKEDKTKNGNKTKLLSLFLFVALPAPLTGVWSASMLSAFLDVSPFKSMLTIALGNLVTASFILALSVLCREYMDLVLWCFFGVTVIGVIITFFHNARKKKRNCKKNNKTVAPSK